MPGVWPTNKKVFSNKMNRKSVCTNKFWGDFGVTTRDEFTEWKKKTDEELQERRDWLASMDRIPLPLGPYPYKSKEHGWVIFSLVDPEWNVCFREKKDFKLGLQYIKTPREGIENPPDNQCKTIEALLMQEYFDPEKHCFAKGKEWKYKLPGKYKLFVCFRVFAC